MPRSWRRRSQAHVYVSSVRGERLCAGSTLLCHRESRSASVELPSGIAVPLSTDASIVRSARFAFTSVGW